MVNNQIERSGEKKHIQIKFDRLTVRRDIYEMMITMIIVTTTAHKPCARQTQANLEQSLKHRCDSRLLTHSLSLSFTPRTPIHTLNRQCDDHVPIYFYNSSICSHVAGDMKRV